MIKAITFDLWNTLLQDKDFTALRMEVMNEVLEEYSIPKSYQEVLKAYRSAAACYRKVWEESYRHMSVESRVEHMLQTLRINLPDKALPRIIDGFQGCFMRDPPELKEGVEETLEGLTSQYKLGLISDTGVTPGIVIRRYLEEIGLLSHFSSTVFSDEVRYCKPHYLVFQKALKELEVKPVEAIHVGDLLRTDITGAKAAGMKSVWLKTKENHSTKNIKPDYTVTTLNQILTIPELRESNR